MSGRLQFACSSLVSISSRSRVKSIGLVNKPVGAAFDRLALGFGIAIGGDHDDGHVGPHLLDLGQHLEAGHAGHVDVGQDQDQRLLDGAGDARQRIRRRNGKIHHETLRAQIAAELLAEQRLDVGLVIDHQNQNAHV